jgi:hypothetical protein
LEYAVIPGRYRLVLLVGLRLAMNLARASHVHGF